MHNLIYRPATKADLKAIVQLLLEGELGKTWEIFSEGLDSRYFTAFDQINQDPNHYLMVVEDQGKIIRTCHLTLLPSLLFTGQTRMQIEAVRISQARRGQGIGQEAITYGQPRGATIIQVTTNQKRSCAKMFYEKLDFEATMKG